MMTTLAELGYDDWFHARAAEILEPGQGVARVMAVDRGVYLLRGEQGDVSAELAGRFRHLAESSLDMPCVGDWVCIECASDELAILHAVLPRKTLLKRKRPGEVVTFQMIAANLDAAFIVQSCHFDLNIARLERYIVVATEAEIEPVVILTKTDLVTAEELEGIVADIRDAGIRTRLVTVSNMTGDGLQGIREILEAGRTYCLLGSSGVGKTTLINRLLGREEFETREVSETGEGVHTTVRRQLLRLDDGALLIDTPGMRELGMLGVGEAVEESFDDVQELAASCRFSNCTHSHEPGCAVRAALESGELDEERVRRFAKLRSETAFHDMTLAQRRKKDRDFGRHIKSVKKSRRKKPRG